jgi:hypothetical protein
MNALPAAGMEARRWTTALGVFLVVGVAYALSGPGRIDTIDGQWRYEVAANLVKEGRPVIRDPALRGSGLPGRDGLRYAYYNAGASVAGFPFVWVGELLGDADGEVQRFLFSLTSAVAGGLLASALYLFYRTLDVENGPALGWTAVSAFGTLLWPLATSAFDQVQHAALVLLAVQLGRASAKRDSIWLAVAGGVAVAVLLNYQEAYLLLVPGLALSTLTWSTSPEAAKGSSRRCWCFLAASGLGIVGWLTYNAVRFGDPLFFFGKLPPEGDPARAVLANPAVGFLSLMFSPGKSIFLYSAPIVLGLLGIRALWRRELVLALTVVTVSAVHLVFVSSLRFFGSDWAWGPRYLVPLLPLWALAFPFVEATTMRRSIVRMVVVLGLLVQVMGVSVDCQRFFFERALPDHFWINDPWFYFRESALLARPGEIAVSLRDGVPGAARSFAPNPYPKALTYTIFGNARRELSPVWMRQFRVFYLPRPWPLWMRFVPPDRRPVRWGPVVLGMLGVGLLGATLVYRAADERSIQEAP